MSMTAQHTAHRIRAGAYTYRGHQIERMQSDGYPPAWFVTDAETGESVMDPQVTLGDARYWIDVAYELDVAEDA